MKNYELTYIVSPELPEKELKTLSEKVNSLIQEETGKIEKAIEPIKKKDGGFLINLNFSLSPDKLASLEKKLKAENQILRYIILIKGIKEEIPAKRVPPRIKKPPEDTKRIIEPKKVELKEIDKKIEEILGE